MSTGIRPAFGISKHGKRTRTVAPGPPGIPCLEVRADADRIPAVVCSDDVFTVEVNCMYEGSMMGVIKNELLQEHTWIGMTSISSGDGDGEATTVTLEFPKDGEMTYHINTDAKRIRLHFELKNK